MTTHRRFIHALVVALMLVGLGATSFRPAAAQVSGDAYTDPAYDWEISWDGDVWSVDENAAYELVLRNEGGGYVFFQDRDEWGDAEACLSGRVDEVAAEDGVDDLEPLEDERGDPIGASSNDRASAAYGLTYTDPNRANPRPSDRVNTFDCRVLVPGEAVLAITFVTPADAYENDVEDVDDLLSDLDIPETSAADETPTGTPEEAATGTPDAEATSTRDASARTPTSTDEPTATQEDRAEARADAGTETVTPEETESLGQAPDPTAGIDGNTYTSPTYGYSLEWDQDVWTPDYERSREPNRDVLILDLFETGGYVYFEAYDAYDGDPGECFIGSSDEALISDAIDDVEPYVDENGDSVAGSEDGVVYGAFSLTLTLDDGTEEEDAAYFECRTLVEGQAVLAVSMLAYEPDFEDARAALDDLLSTLDLSDVQSGTDAENGTETPESDEETVTSIPDDEETATPEADDQAGVNGDVYVSPTYGYTLAWDEDVWEVDEEFTGSRDRDTLKLDYGSVGYVLFEGYEEYDGDAEDCLEGVANETLEDPATDNVEPYEDENGVGLEGEFNGAPYAAYTFEFDGVAAASLFQCQTLVEGEAVLAISLIVAEDDFKDAFDALAEVVDTIELQGDAGSNGDDDATATPEDDETATPEDDETATPDGDNGGAGVNGNSYESPTYGYTLEWDEDIWEVYAPNTILDRDGDALGIDYYRDDELVGTLNVYAYDRTDTDPEACREDLVAEYLDLDDVADAEPLEDDNGDLIEGEEDGVSFAAYSLDLNDSRTVGYFTCQTLVEDESVLTFALLVRRSFATDAIDALMDLQSTLDIPESGQDQSTATPEQDDEETATPEADDEETATPEDDGDAGVNGDTYESPTYGYTLEWDADVWEVNEDLTASADRDALVLDYVDGGRLFVEGYEAYGGDPEDCLDASADEIITEDGVDNVEPYEDRNGDPIEGEEDGVVFVAYTFDVDNDAAVGYFTCQTLVEDEAVLAFSLIAFEEVGEDGIDAFMDIQSSLDLGGNSNADSTSTPAPDDEETPTPESGGDDAGVNGNAYESPTYGYTLEWDRDVWEVDEASSEDGVDRLVLTDAGSTVTFEAMEGFDGDAEACVAAAEDEIAGRRGVDDVEVLEDEDGPIAEGDEESAYAYYGYTLEPRNGDTEQRFEYVECSALGDGASVLRVSQAALVADADDEIDARNTLLDGLELASGGPMLWRSARTIAA